MMRQLFKQWSELAPTECQRRETSVFDSDVYTVDGTNFFVSDTSLICFMPGEAEMWLERALRQAIVARGWEFAINPIHWRVGNFYEVVISTPGKDGWHESENIAMALLTAYVGAIAKE